jgi:hypothetical protein
VASFPDDCIAVRFQEGIVVRRPARARAPRRAFALTLAKSISSRQLRSRLANRSASPPQIARRRRVRRRARRPPRCRARASCRKDPDSVPPEAGCDGIRGRARRCDDSVLPTRSSALSAALLGGTYAGLPVRRDAVGSRSEKARPASVGLCPSTWVIASTMYATAIGTATAATFSAREALTRYRSDARPAGRENTLLGSELACRTVTITTNDLRVARCAAATGVPRPEEIRTAVSPGKCVSFVDLAELGGKSGIDGSRRRHSRTRPDTK